VGVSTTTKNTLTILAMMPENCDRKLLRVLALSTTNVEKQKLIYALTMKEAQKFVAWKRVARA